MKTILLVFLCINGSINTVNPNSNKMFKIKVEIGAGASKKVKNLSKTKNIEKLTNSKKLDFTKAKPKSF